MFKIMLMPDVEKFLNLVMRSCGDVLLHLPDGSQSNLKRDRTAQQMLRIMKPGRDGIAVSLSNSSDMPAFFQYLMETAL